MSRFFSFYFPSLTFALIIFQIFINLVLNDILIGSLPGDYGKASKEAIRIREKLSPFERMTQKYIGQYVIEKYRTDYHFYIFFKVALVMYYLLSVLALAALILTGEEQGALFLWKATEWINAVAMLFFITRFDLNRTSKYTRNK